MSTTKATDSMIDSLDASKVTGALPAISGANLTNLTAGNLSGTLAAVNGSNLTSLPAGNLTGTVADARISTLTASKLSGALPAIDGSNLTNLPPGFTTNSGDPAVTTNPSGGVGTVWINTTSGEVYVCTDATSNENVWTNVGAGTGDVKLQWYGGRGVHMGGTTNTSYGGHTDNMSYVAISTPGNAADFGNMTNSRLGGIGTASNNTRLVMAGGSNNYPTSLNTMDYITVASTGNATDYGDLTTACRYKGGVSNGTRGVYAGGYEAGSDPGQIASIDYRDVASTGNCSDFGDLSAAGQAGQHWSNGTRAIIASVGGNTNVIEYITVASTGNSTDFGDMTESSYSDMVGGSETRACGATGNNNNTIYYVTMASTGNAQDFGDMTAARGVGGSCSDASRMLMWPGRASNTTIDYITVSTTGNAIDFGDLNYVSEQMGAGSGA